VNNLLQNFNKAFESKVRLGVMSVLMVNESTDFNTLKDLLKLSDGNLASHVKALEELKYVSVTKQFVGKKPNTTYFVTVEGKIAFNEHLNALENLIKEQLKQ
jgi:DNA-binding MarR family transcriptional regulator